MERRSVEEYTFEDLFDMESIQKLTDAVSMALEVGVVIMSPKGVPITKPSNFGHFCMDIVRKTPVGSLNCKHSDAIMGQKSDKPIVSKCLSAGLVDAGISIIIDGKHIASWMVGQVMIEEERPSEEEQRERARTLGIDEELFLEGIRTVPCKTREQFQRIVSMVQVIAMQLSDLGLKSYLQKEELLYRRNLEEKLRSEKARLEKYHQFDDLTGVYTRVYYEDCLQDLVSDPEQYPIVLISGDMNNLKLTNDVFGHQSGDAALKMLGDIMKQEAHSTYLIGRCGGDEFCIAIPRSRIAEAQEYCERVQRSCMNIKEAMLPPTISMGYHVLESPEDDLQEGMRMAEEAMYNAKVQKKATQNIHEDIMDVLFKKQYISRKQTRLAVERVVRFAEYLKLDDYTVQLLELAAEIQDVGLIAVPEHVVKKVEKRNDEEYRLMAKHPEIGYRLARLYDESFPVADTILQSHECWYGYGYPNHLKEKEILYTARILYMVGTYSYWIYERPTGSGMNVPMARKRLRGEAGKQFDPDLVDKFLEYLESEE